MTTHETGDQNAKRRQPDDKESQSPIEIEHEAQCEGDGHHPIKEGGEANDQAGLNVLDVVNQALQEVSLFLLIKIRDRSVRIGRVDDEANPFHHVLAEEGGQKVKAVTEGRSDDNEDDNKKKILA